MAPSKFFRAKATVSGKIEYCSRTFFLMNILRVARYGVASSLSQQQMGYRPLLNIYDLIDRVLDKGIVIDANISVALVGIEILVVRARIVVAGIDAFLRYAQALGLAATPGTPAPLSEVPAR